MREQPPPPSLQPVSDATLPCASSASVVPPTEMTLGDDDGYSATANSSPEAAKMLTPDWKKCASSFFSVAYSPPPQLFDTYCACVFA